MLMDTFKNQGKKNTSKKMANISNINIECLKLRNWELTGHKAFQRAGITEFNYLLKILT